MDRARGALVAGIVEGGPVDDGSIEPGDVIIEFDGKPVETTRELPRIVADTPVGKAVDVVVIRKGEQMDIKVTLGRLEDSDELAMAPSGDEEGDMPADPAETIELYGMTLAELDDIQREAFKIEDSVERGVVITEVAQNSAAAEKGIRPGETIVEIAQEAVANPQEVVDSIEELKSENRRNALLMLAAPTGELRFVTVRID